MQKTAIFWLGMSVALYASAMVACGSEDVDSGDGDIDIENVSEEGDTDNISDFDMEAAKEESREDEVDKESEVISDSDSDADNPPVQHGREVIPERVAAQCTQYPQWPESGPWDIPSLPEGNDCYWEDDSDECNNHTDCNAAANGYCGILRYNSMPCSDEIGPCTCDYHECLSDDDCQQGDACFCGFSQYLQKKSVCAPSCRSSADCGDGSKCRQALIYIVYDMEHGYIPFYEDNFPGACTGAEDECDSDWDCPADYYCVYGKDEGHFICRDYSTDDIECK